MVRSGRFVSSLKAGHWMSISLAYILGFVMNSKCSDEFFGREFGFFLVSAFRIFYPDCGDAVGSKESEKCGWKSCGIVTKLGLKVLGLVMAAALLNRNITYLRAAIKNVFAVFKVRQEKCGLWRKKLLFAGVISGILISIWIYMTMSANMMSRHEENLANMCDERAKMLQDQFNVSMNHVHALAILVSTFHHGKNPSAVDQPTFAEYTARTAFDRPLTSGVAYAPRVVNSERDQFEKEQGWTIKKMGTEDQSPVRNDYTPEKLDPCPVQDEYAPVIFSQETVSHIVSIDMMSGKEDRENILRARATGKGVLTSPFKLLKSNHLGVVLTFAVYDRDLPSESTEKDRIEATVGYLGASFDVPSLAEKLLQQLASTQTIVVNVYDTTNESSPIRMYGPEEAGTGLLHVSHVDFGDPIRKHEMHCRFKQKLPPPWAAATMSGGVLVIVLLLGHIFHAAINRIEKMEDDYHEMRELKGRAEAADVAKSQFLATVSHEIRTPMNGVLGMLQMLMDTDLDATQQDYAMTAQDSGKALIALINELLDQAKIESGRVEVEAVPFDVRAVLDSVLSLFSDKSLEKGLELAVWVSDVVPEVLIGDPGRFRQIITNLVGNSIKFTEKGHILLSLRLAEEAKKAVKEADSSLTLSGFCTVDRGKVWERFKIVSENSSLGESDLVNILVTVEDTGKGIPRKAQSRIFMPFMQADSSTSRTYGGTGIGLSISKCLIHLRGGEIGFESVPGVGSTFSFTAVFREGRHHTSAASSEFSGMTALVLDRRRLRADVTKYHLRRLGINTDVAINAHADIVLVDEEGFDKEKLTDLRQRESKIFILAAPRRHGDNGLIVDLADGVIRKPLRPSVISACIHKAMGLKMEKRLGKGRPHALSILNGRRILVVDDNAVNRKVAAGALKKFGADIICVDSGKAAVEMLRPPHYFDACFMDIQMPEMDGFEATALVRSTEQKFNEENDGDPGQWHVPILAMTADVIQATHVECAKFGMDDYVSKPFEEDQLYAAVSRFFQQKSADDQTSLSNPDMVRCARENSL